MRTKRPKQKEDIRLTEQINVRCDPRLYAIIAHAAQKAYPKTMGEILVSIAAEHFGRPDLGIVPKKRTGRPPKQRSAVPA
jgi:hypothetical protein